MTLREDLAVLPRRVHDLSNNLATALTNIRNEVDAADSISDHTPGASIAEARTPRILDGNCLDYRHDPILGSVECGRARPCPDHDVNDVRLNPVERSAARVTVLMRARADLLEQVGALLHQVGKLERAVRRWAPPEPIDSKGMLCHGTATYPGYHVPLRDGGWYDELCKKVADPTKGGLCDTCWGREVAWRATQNLPPRERTNVAVVRDIPMCTRGDGNTATPGRNDGLCAACRMRDSRARSKAS